MSLLFTPSFEIKRTDITQALVPNIQMNNKFFGINDNDYVYGKPTFGAEANTKHVNMNNLIGNDFNRIFLID